MWVVLLQMLPRAFPDLTAVGFLAMLLPAVLIAVMFQNWNSGPLQISATLTRWRLRGQSFMQRVTGFPWSNMGFSALVGICSGCIVSLFLTMNMQAISLLSQLMAIGVILYTHLNEPLREHSQEQRRRRNKMEEISQSVQSMPIEEFVPEETINDLSISHLKDMLRRRKLPKEEIDSYIDKHNLIEELQKRRKYCDTCCICFESFEPAEPLRILPKCGHEIHIECLDKWAYTFASFTKRDQSPSCPLCKEGFR